MDNGKWILAQHHSAMPMSINHNIFQTHILPEAIPLVSVIIPVFNGEKFVAEAIDSALAQDYVNLEIIVVDDGSTDGSKRILESYGNKIQMFSQTNQGCAAARNTGLRHASGKYVAFLDADDVWWNNKIACQVEALATTGFRMAYSRFAVWCPASDGRYPLPDSIFSVTNNPHLSNSVVETGCIYRALLLDCIVWTSTVIIEKSVFDEVGIFDEALELGEDYDLWLRLSRHLPILGLQQPTALYRTHSSSITHTAKAVNYEYRVLSGALNRWGEGTLDGSIRPSRAIRARLARSMFNHGYTHYKCGNPSVAAASFLRSLKHGDIRFKSLLLLLFSIIKSQFHRG